MLIKRLELLTSDLPAQYEYYHHLLELPAEIRSNTLTVLAGLTELVFKQAPANWTGQYHFCFNIPKNQFTESKKWISTKCPLLKGENGADEFQSESWNSNSLYFKDAGGNILEFIARHDQQNAIDKPFDRMQILQVSEIGLPSKDVILFAKELCGQLGVSVYKQDPSETFTPIGDEDGLFILPVENRIWYPNTGVSAKQLEVQVVVEINGRSFGLNGVPYSVNIL